MLKYYLNWIYHYFFPLINKKKILFIDVETSGLPRNYRLPYNFITNWPRVVQIAWKLGTDKDVTSYMIKPDFPESFQSVDIHGITKEQAMADGRPMQDVLQELLEVLKDVDVVCAHNIQFDMNVIMAEFVRYELPLNMVSKLTQDTMLSGARLNANRWPKLEKCFQLCCPGRKLPGPLHDAGTDVLICEACYNALERSGEMMKPRYFGSK